MINLILLSTVSTVFNSISQHTIYSFIYFVVTSYCIDCILIENKYLIISYIELIQVEDEITNKKKQI